MSIHKINRLIQNYVISFWFNPVDLMYTHNNYILIEGLRSKVD